MCLYLVIPETVLKDFCKVVSPLSNEEIQKFHKLVIALVGPCLPMHRNISNLLVLCGSRRRYVVIEKPSKISSGYLSGI